MLDFAPQFRDMGKVWGAMTERLRLKPVFISPPCKMDALRAMRESAQRLKLVPLSKLQPFVTKPGAENHGETLSPNKGGRPRVHASGAAKQKAYRNRKGAEA